MRSFLLAKIASDLAAKRSRIFSATTRSAGSSEARGSGTTLCSVALTGPVGCAGVASMVAAGDSLAGAVGAEDVSVEACPSGDAPVGTAAKLPPFAKTLKRAARITAKAIPAKMRSQRGPFMRRRSPRQAQSHRAGRRNLRRKNAKEFGDFGARSRLLIVRSVAGSGRRIGALL